MLRKKKKITENRQKWNQEKAPSRKKSTKGSAVSGTGRYIIGFILLAAIFWFVGGRIIEKIMAHQVFTARNVVVEGADYIDKKEIIKTAAVPVGENVFEIDFKKISGNLKSTYAAEDFVVFRRLPDTIAIRVQERKPVALLNMQTIIGVDIEGMPLPHVGASYVETLPIITGIKSVSELSDSTAKTRLVTGLQLLRRISSDSPAVYKRISEVDVSDISEMGITLIDNGLEIIIGSDDWARKIPNLDKVIQKVTEQIQTVKVVDIRFGEKIFIRKK